MSVFSRPEGLALGFVECTTEFDWTDLPEDVQSALMDAAGVFLAWSNPEVVTVTERQERAVSS